MARKSLDWLTARPIAHRGYHDRAAGRPENSLAAFQAAIDADYAIECDLHPSSDGVPMVFHDDTLDRLTGVKGSVRDRTAAELGKLRLHGTEERVPTLDELLELTAGRVPLVIELKHIAGRDTGFAASVVEKISRYDGPAALMSFDTRLIADIRDADPAMPRGLTAEGDLRTSLDHISSMVALGVDFVSYRIDDLPTPAGHYAQNEMKIPLICWTVRTDSQRERAERHADQITFEGFAA